MPRRLSKKMRDDAIYGCWYKYMCTYGIVEARKIVYGAYKEIRRQHEERKVKYGKKKKRKTNRCVKVHRKDTSEN
jgi:hypothetical protein